MNIHTLIHKYLSGNFSEGERIELMNWIQQSESNTRLFEEYKRIWELSSQFSNTITVDTQKALAKFKSNVVIANTPSAGEVKRHKIKPPFLLAVAAGLGLLIFSAILFRYYQNTSDHEVFSTKFNHAKEPILLLDGSKVHLNKESVLLTSNVFNQKERKVRLEGEGHFVIHPNQDKPFIIELPHCQSSIKVIGTQFNVHAYSKSEKTEVTVIEGQVEYLVDSKKYKLLTGDKFILQNNSRSVEIIRDENLNARSWVTKTLTFRNTTLDKVVADINKAYNVELNLETPCLAAYRFTSTLDMNTHQNAKDILKILAVTFHLRLIEHTNEKYTLQGDCQ